METNNYEIALGLLQLAGLMARAAVAIAAQDTDGAVEIMHQCAEEFGRLNQRMPVQ